MAKWCNEGENQLLDVYLKNATQNSNLYLGLFKNSSEPGEAAVMTDITEETGTGYARITLAPADWTISGTAPTQAQHTKKTFSAGSDWGNVYGYFITTTSSGTAGKLIAVEAFTNGPYNIQNGGSVDVTAKITCD